MTESMPDGPTTIVCIPRDSSVLAGVPAVIRTLYRLVASGAVERILLCGASDRFRRRWRGLLRRLPGRVETLSTLPAEIASASPAIVLDGRGIPDGEGLLRFCREARSRRETSVWIWNGRPVCLYKPAGVAFGDGWSEGAGLDSALESASVRRVEAPATAWVPLRDPEEIARARKGLFAKAGRESDGYLSRLDRRISTALSRLWVETPVTPNQLTAISIAVGLGGAWLLASGGYAESLLGVGLVWLSAILDGCDGEVARIKLMSTERGERLDLFGDHVVNLSVLAAVAAHVRRTRPSAAWGPAAALLAAGVLTSALVFWWFALRTSRSGRAPSRALERIASRDFVYLLIPLAALRRLDWFFYAAAVGSNLFWIVLLTRRWSSGSRRLGGDGIASGTLGRIPSAQRANRLKPR